MGKVHANFTTPIQLVYRQRQSSISLLEQNQNEWKNNNDFLVNLITNYIRISVNDSENFDY